MTGLNNFRRIVSRMNPDPVLAELERFPDFWDLITIRQQYEGSAHRDTKSIILRGPTTLEGLMDNLEAVDFEVLTYLPATFDLIVRAAQAVQATSVGRAMLVKLAAGGRVSPHVDEGGYAAHYSRFHVVLTSTPQCWFRAGGEKVHMAPGELWWFNHRVVHEVRNKGDTDRIHMIVDMTAPSYQVQR